MRIALFLGTISLAVFFSAVTSFAASNTQNNGHHTNIRSLPKSSIPTGVPAAISSLPDNNNNVPSQDINSVKNSANNSDDIRTSDSDAKKEKDLLVDKLLKLNYVTYNAPKQLYEKNPSPFNTHLPPVYFESYYLETTFKAVEDNDYGKLRAILDKFDFLNGQNEDGDTILISAVQHRSIDSARILLAKGAYVDAVNIRKRTALHYAAALGDVNLTKLLLTMGANFNLKDDKDMTALEYAEFSNQSETAKIIRAYISQ